MAKKKLETLEVAERTATGKGPNRRLRAQGVIPGVYYDQKGANILFQVEELPLSRLYQKVGSTQVFNLTIGGGEPLPSLIWRFKHDPVRTMPQHVDFFGVDLDKELKVFVPFALIGESAGVKLGGILEVYRDGIEVSGKPLDIPEAIEIDVTELDINDAVHIEEVELPEGVQADFDENFTVVAVNMPSEEEEETEDLLGESEELEEGEEASEEADSDD